MLLKLAILKKELAVEEEFIELIEFGPISIWVVLCQWVPFPQVHSLDLF